MTTWVEDCLQMADDCEKRESRLTDWEAGFVDSIKTALLDERLISQKQIDALNEIWERATENG